MLPPDKNPWLVLIYLITRMLLKVCCKIVGSPDWQGVWTHHLQLGYALIFWVGVCCPYLNPFDLKHGTYDVLPSSTKLSQYFLCKQVVIIFIFILDSLLCMTKCFIFITKQSLFCEKCKKILYWLNLAGTARAKILTWFQTQKSIFFPISHQI